MSMRNEGHHSKTKPSSTERECVAVHKLKQ